jgi:hypothetical protein
MDSVPAPSRTPRQVLLACRRAPRCIVAMPNSISPEKAFGYLSTIESPEHGFFGGYLLISCLGRPLEFHCTAPIRPSRAQQILYGPTLEPYLLGEQICGALLETAKLKPCVIITDSAAALHSRTKSLVPIAQIIGREELQAQSSDVDQIEPGEDLGDLAGLPRLRSRSPSGEIALGRYRLRLSAGYERDEDKVIEALSTLVKHVQLGEPFARIHEAIREAQRIGGRGTDANEQAA